MISFQSSDNNLTTRTEYQDLCFLHLLQKIKSFFIIWDIFQKLNIREHLMRFISCISCSSNNYYSASVLESSG